MDGLDLVVELNAERGPQMPIRVERCRDAGVTQTGLYFLGVGALGDEQTGGRMAKIVIVPTSA